MIQPMRDEVVALGAQELRTAQEVDSALKQEGTTLVFINSVCGCAAGCARPGLTLAMKYNVRPDRFVTAFAGNDKEAVQQARSYFTGFAPSSPAMAILKDGELVWMLERWQIEGRNPLEIEQKLTQAFDKHCATVSA